MNASAKLVSVSSAPSDLAIPALLNFFMSSSPRSQGEISVKAATPIPFYGMAYSVRQVRRISDG